MKRSGLPWSPHVGCFVWDPDGEIRSPSPFPNRIYFILNLRRFTQIFGDAASMQAKLVWLPTWHQALGLCRSLGADLPAIDVSRTDSADGLLRLYAAIAHKLDVSRRRAPERTSAPVAENDAQWLEAVMTAELGPLSDLPGSIQPAIRSAYRDVARAYLGWRRIQTQQDPDWLPPEHAFDPKLLAELAHFYSDYQHQIRAIERIRRTVRLWRAIDPDANPRERDRIMQAFIDSTTKAPPSPPILEQLAAPDETHRIS